MGTGERTGDLEWGFVSRHCLEASIDLDKLIGTTVTLVEEPQVPRARDKNDSLFI